MTPAPRRVVEQLRRPQRLQRLRRRLRRRRDPGDHVARLREAVRSTERTVADARRRIDVVEDDAVVAARCIEIVRTDLLPPVDRPRIEQDGETSPELQRGAASFAGSLRWHRRNRALGVWEDEGLVEPALEFDSKLRSRDFVAAHGVPLPELYARWATPDDITWDDLPEQFVLKNTHGLGSYGVFPLQHDQGRYLDGITQQHLTREEVTEALWARHKPESVYFAEEYLAARDGTGRMPHDIKVFCCYGEPLYMEVRRDVWNRLGGAGTARVRSFLPDGTELAAPRPFMPAGNDLPEPKDFAAVSRISSLLSGALRRPFIRIDLYETPRGLVFGEFGKNPQHTPSLLPSLDARFGKAYEAAAARLWADLAGEGHLATRSGRRGAEVAP